MADRDGFVHLHVHTEYSMLDGAARVKDLFAEAARLEMPALAMTDHGNVYGAFDFYKRGQGRRGQARSSGSRATTSRRAASTGGRSTSAPATTSATV